MNNFVSLLSLPNEILYQITRYLKLGDLISLSQTCNHLKTVCSLLKTLDCCEQYDVKPETLNSFLKTCVNPVFVTVCNFNHCYWIPAKILQPALHKFTNLEVLHVAETRLTCKDISHILVRCCKTKCLSLTISSVEDFWTADPNKIGFAGKDLETIFSKTYFAQCLEIMKNISELHIYGLIHLDTIASLLSMCSLLEELHLVLSTNGRVWTLLRSHVPIKILNLHSVFFHSTLLDGPFASELMDALNETLFPKLPRLKVCWFHIHEPRGAVQLQSWRKSDGIEAFQYPHKETLNFNAETGTLKSFTVTSKDILPHSVSSLRHLKVVGPTQNEVKKEELAAFVDSNPEIEILDLQMGIQCNFANRLSRLSVLNIVDSRITADFFSALAANCPVLEDLSIGNPFLESRKSGLNETDLVNVSKLGRLRRLSLRELQVKSGNFVGLILQRCDRLESVMLENIGPSGLCCYTNQLTTNLVKARKLNHLLIHQKNVVPLGKLLDSVQKCKSLRQLGLILPSSTDPFKMTLNGFCNRMKILVKELPRLVALNCVFSVPKIHCEKAGRNLNQVFREERPAFVAVLKNAESIYPETTEDLPLVHQKISKCLESPRIVYPFGHVP